MSGLHVINAPGKGEIRLLKKLKQGVKPTDKVALITLEEMAIPVEPPFTEDAELSRSNNKLPVLGKVTGKIVGKSTKLALGDTKHHNTICKILM